MKLVVRNLGIVDYAEIDLNKDLTLFCGPNGTGKTYVAYLLNALFNLKTDVILPVNDKVKENLLHNKIEIEPAYVNIWVKAVENKLKSQLPSIFGISPKEADKMFQSVEITLSLEGTEFDSIVDYEAKFFYLQKLNSKIRFVRISSNKGSCYVNVGVLENANEESECQKAVSEICSYIFKSVLLGVHGSKMLTVERNSIYTFKTELLANRLETVDNVLISDSEEADEIIRQRATLYPQAIRNSLKIANELPEVIKKDSEYSEFASEIESQLLLGSVSVGKEGDVRFEPTSASERSHIPLPIQMSSSSVKTLSGLVVYLRHLAKNGDILIIDEPEMNLHPDNQRRLAQIFARIINQGIRLIISTHSDYIIRELNNLIMFSALLNHNNNVDTLYSKKDVIDKRRVQAFLFDFMQGHGVSVIPIMIDDFGFEVRTIDNTIEAQNEQTIVLRDSLEDLKQI